MAPQTFTYPTQAEIEQAILHARQMRAEAFRHGLRTLTHWIAHPSLHPQHA